MKNTLVGFGVLILVFLSCGRIKPQFNPILSASKIDKIDSLANRYLELNRFSGSILVSKEDTIIYKNSFGLADYENRLPFNDSTAFKIGQITELVTANILKDLVKQDKLQLSDSIALYLPKLKVDFSIDDLLHHNTRLATIKTIQEQHPEIDYSIIAYTNLGVKSLDSSEYSELNYNLLGLLIESISGKSFQQNIEDYSEKLKLVNTYFQKSDSALAVGYLYKKNQGNGLELQKAPISRLELNFSSNGLKSTVSDLVKIINSNPEQTVDIDGYLDNDGFSYSVLHKPSTKISIIVLSNRRHPVAKEISNSIEAILQNESYHLPLARTPVEIDKKLLKDYEGLYVLNGNMNLEVIAENDSLFMIMGPNKIHLIPQSNTQFYIEQMDASMRFIKDRTNKVNEVVLLDGFLDGNHIKRTIK